MAVSTESPLLAVQLLRPPLSKPSLKKGASHSPKLAVAVAPALTTIDWLLLVYLAALAVTM